MRPPEVVVESQPPSVPMGEKSVESPACLQIVRIEVWKEEHMLKAYCARGSVISMKVAIGRQKIGPKLRSGDHRTPEGRYQIAGGARQSRFHLFIPIDYPSEEDAIAARTDGRLAAADFERIVEAHRAGLSPPYETPLGGDVGFHGEGERWKGESHRLDWTYGCIAVTDDEIEFLADRIEYGVPVWIHP